MPKHSPQHQAFAVDAALMARELTSAATVFRAKVKATLEWPTFLQLGTQWYDFESVSSPGFAIETRSGNVIAAFDHVSAEGQLRGRYRFYRISGTPIKPELEEFWSFLINESGSATWTIHGEFEWTSGNDAEIGGFIYRLLIEFYKTIDKCDKPK